MTFGRRLSLRRTSPSTSYRRMGSVSPLASRRRSIAELLPRPGMAGGTKTLTAGSGIFARTSWKRFMSGWIAWSGRLRCSHGRRSTIIMFMFSPRPPIMDMPEMARTELTSGISSESSFVARETRSTERWRVEPSGSSSEQKMTRWSSSGRKEVEVVMNICTVRKTTSSRSISVRKMRLASQRAHETKKPLKCSRHQLNHAKGPCR